MSTYRRLCLIGKDNYFMTALLQRLRLTLATYQHTHGRIRYRVVRSFVVHTSSAYSQQVLRLFIFT
jgi:hypothetical protein